jgi:hypothetical protein
MLGSTESMRARIPAAWNAKASIRRSTSGSLLRSFSRPAVAGLASAKPRARSWMNASSLL